VQSAFYFQPLAASPSLQVFEVPPLSTKEVPRGLEQVVLKEVMLEGFVAVK